MKTKTTQKLLRNYSVANTYRKTERAEKELVESKMANGGWVER